jgi:hypothetical protein
MYSGCLSLQRIAFVAAIIFTAGATQPAAAQSAATPMSCSFEGKIIRILDERDADKTSPCHKNPCRAAVKVLSIGSCGQGVTAGVNEGDTVIMQFAYTLKASQKLFPKMVTHYPGLKKGNTFSANAEQRLRMGGKSEFIVYGYTKK